MTTATILDRLQLCNLEIAGIKRSWRLPPTKPIGDPDLPGVFNIPGEMLLASPSRAPGFYLLTRRFIVRVLVSQSGVAALDSSDEGSRILADVVPYLDACAEYYVGHPRLHTATLPELAGVMDDVTFLDDGPRAGLLGPDGTQYAGFNFVLTISEYRSITASRLT
jgi:hypothetical protein